MQDFTNYNPNSYDHARATAAARALSSEAAFFQKVYAWMFLGLVVTALVAYVGAMTPAWMNFLRSGRYAIIGVVLVELGVVWYLSAWIQQLAPSTAKGLFVAYSALSGATFSVIVAVYPSAAIAKAFICTAGVYGAMALFGLLTKRSLQGWGSFLFMGLFGVIIASVINLFMRSSSMDWVICVIGVLVFAGLTAYDHQKLRVIHATALGEASDDDVSRVVIIGALELYLDFINLFLMLLRFFGNSRD